MKRTHLAIASLSLLTLTACEWTDIIGGNGSASSASSSTSSVDMEETDNVTYRGTLEDAGVSIFMQGTHKLTLDDGRFILLESEDVNLDRYIDMSVEVFGSVRPTVEQGGMIMRVESVTTLSSSSSSSSSKIFCGGIAGFPCPDGMSCMDDPSDSCDPENGGADCGGMCVPTDSSSSNSSEAVSSISSATVSSVRVSSATVSAASSAASVASGDLSAKAEIMAKANMDAANWTQTYCSTHIEFCMPVHRNWWYTSFGAATSSLWHVEIGPSEMTNLGEGPITVRLLSGDIASSGMADGQVIVQGGTAVGAKAWTNGRRFEVRAPASLEAAVRYITQNIRPSAS